MTVSAAEIPLGISEVYDLLPPEGEELDVRCQSCDKIFVDQMRKNSEGARVLAVFCSICRACRRLRFAAPLPGARTLRSCKVSCIIRGMLNSRRSRE